jgi:hypothetical protein
MSPRLLCPFQSLHFALSSSSRSWRRITVVQFVNALCDLPEVLKSHGDMKPVQDMLRFRRNLLLNRPESGVSIGEGRQTGLFIDTAATSARSTAVAASELPRRTNAKRTP